MATLKLSPSVLAENKAKAGLKFRLPQSNWPRRSDTSPVLGNKRLVNPGNRHRTCPSADKPPGVTTPPNSLLPSGSRRTRGPKGCVTHLSADDDEGPATITITDPLAIIGMARGQPVVAAHAAQTAWITLDTGFREHRIGIIAAAYAAAYHMIRTDRAWEQFIKHPGWGGLGRRPKNTLNARNNMLRHVLRFVFQAKSNKVKRRVRVYALMLDRRYHAGFKPEDVMPLIKRHGIECLREQEAARRKAEAPEAGPDHYFADLNDDVDRKPGKPPRKSAWGTQPAAQRSWPDLTLEQRREGMRRLRVFVEVMEEYYNSR
ncbi:hypothetical protein [Methylobacterium longum]|uniref:Uncharacterized protein n=1 Tax=Methylobacterium longum TaxID=767694 RepID=A0ABT8AK35_9HYPH|nr:hypothetical protein [Methylobacterium longum]MDN3570165.1 hypothetical protein [Methylobacterium longum]GJE12241.1 hypothetical protein FOHLNKBM_3288 [Methylobacterium longum]